MPGRIEQDTDVALRLELRFPRPELERMRGGHPEIGDLEVEMGAHPRGALARRPDRRDVPLGTLKTEIRHPLRRRDRSPIVVLLGDPHAD